MRQGNILLGGKISLLERDLTKWSKYELTPWQTRRIFEERNWAKIVGFHTRNVIHRGHEFIQMEALERSLCDGLFVHPVIGTKKKGDFQTDIIIKSYEIMLNRHYPKDKVVFSVFKTYSRYGGPREALFTALCRKNHGCSHFIIGRDHNGVGDYYHPYASHAIFDQFPDIGIKPIKFQEIYYLPERDQYYHQDKPLDYERVKASISGAIIREHLSNHSIPPDWLMRPDISKMIAEKIANSEKVFVE